MGVSINWGVHFLGVVVMGFRARDVWKLPSPSAKTLPETSKPKKPAPILKVPRKWSPYVPKYYVVLLIMTPSQVGTPNFGNEHTAAHNFNLGPLGSC